MRIWKLCLLLVEILWNSDHAALSINILQDLLQVVKDVLPLNQGD